MVKKIVKFTKILKIVKYWGGVENEIDSISGIFETVNLHSKTKKFHIFPVGINKRVRCTFPKELLNQYRHSYFPFKITVTDIEIYPEEEELPILFDLKGIC